MLHGIVAPPLPFCMRLDVVLDECVPERRITAFVHGDLEGTARLTFDGDDAEARAHATQTIELVVPGCRWVVGASLDVRGVRG